VKIIYVAKHQSGGNDDEGAIGHALEQLGHEVIRIQERKGIKARNKEGDFLLFHKWEDIFAVGQSKLPKVFWYFDLVDFPDPTLAHRNNRRIQWMKEVTPLVDLGLCTDGDWVKQDTTGKLVHLTQGADERITKVDGPSTCPLCRKEAAHIPLLFTGIQRGGVARQSFVKEMFDCYGTSFRHVIHGTHREDLADLLSSTAIVVAPDSPITNDYWSNRVYLTLGMGGFLLHPYCSQLADHYTDKKEIVFYHNREELHKLIRYYRGRLDEREKIQQAGYERTRREHTYKERCKKLIRLVQERVLC